MSRTTTASRPWLRDNRRSRSATSAFGPPHNPGPRTTSLHHRSAGRGHQIALRIITVVRGDPAPHYGPYRAPDNPAAIPCPADAGNDVITCRSTLVTRRHSAPEPERGPERSGARLSLGCGLASTERYVPFRSGQNVRLRCAISSVGHSVATIVSVGLRAFSLSTARFACAHLPAAESEQRPDESWCGTCQPERGAVTSAGSDGCVGWRLRFRRAADGDDLDR